MKNSLQSSPAMTRSPMLTQNESVVLQGQSSPYASKFSDTLKEPLTSKVTVKVIRPRLLRWMSASQPRVQVSNGRMSKCFLSCRLPKTPRPKTLAGSIGGALVRVEAVSFSS